MVDVLIYTESRFPTQRSKIRDFVQKYLVGKVKGTVEVGINIVGNRKMRRLNNTYRNINETTDVLSFPVSDPSVATNKDFVVGFSPERSSPDKVLRLGDVVISYPQTVVEAAEENRFVDKQLEILIAHGLNHLLGIHHS
jgi:probable rRNA maturation factor